MPLFQRWKKSPSKLLTKTLGQTAEDLACQHLIRAGLSIVATNYRTPRGEVDIIARDNDCYVFVEVRLRSSTSFGSASDSITQAKQRKIVYAATHYLQKQQLWEKVPCRFDSICIDRHTCADNYQLEWTPDAFASS